MHKLLLSFLFIPCVVQGVKTSVEQHRVEKYGNTYIHQRNDSTKIFAQKVDAHQYYAIAIPTPGFHNSKVYPKVYRNCTAMTVFKSLKKKYHSQNK